MDEQPTWTDCDEDGDYNMPNVLSPRDLVSRADNMDETVPHTLFILVKLSLLFSFLSIFLASIGSQLIQIITCNV